MIEKRSEDRKPAKGKVWFAPEGAGSSEFSGRLFDVSKSGFRATHSNAGLSTGQRVLFRHSRGKGCALVMWNRILDPNVESGFLILDE
jgi:hypothetical protein